ncbi:Ger(x)C family spore germination protein [Anaerobacillus alkaliphilus]|uniref:Ger(X)C family spore germination protein n=1 Tax=Anaerobacillus alkaliphilus TaxID=1548597 RepID=A0A4V1LFX9_9BACI|nr:Ger(x)C family spore germination protein [Anaerobacillus alkaliphilus]RXI97824.1 Ger(x)C family spore germination protein [Anaerobacillus alkaliphilus]
MRKLLLLFYITSLILSGCAQKRIVEDMGFIHSIGFELNEAEDAEEEGILTITITFPQVRPSAAKDHVVLSTIAHTSKEGRTKLARQTERVLVSGQLRSVMFGDTLAKMGFFDTIDTFKRDHAVGLNLKVIVVNGSPKEMLMTEFPEHPRIGRYIFELLEKEAQTHVTVDTSLHEFIRDYYDDGIDPIVPLMKAGKEEVILDGIGLFNGDKLAMQVDPKKARVFLMLHENHLGGTLTKQMRLKNETKEDDYLYITFNTLESTRKVNVQSPSEIQVNIDVKGSIDEFTGYVKLSDDEAQKDIEKKLAAYIKETSEEIIEEMQQNQTDSLGFGQFVRNSLSYKNWKEMKWKEEIYPDAKIDVNVNVKLKGFGDVK